MERGGCLQRFGAGRRRVTVSGCRAGSDGVGRMGTGTRCGGRRAPQTGHWLCLPPHLSPTACDSVSPAAWAHRTLLVLWDVATLSGWRDTGCPDCGTAELGVPERAWQGGSSGGVSATSLPSRVQQEGTGAAAPSHPRLQSTQGWMQNAAPGPGGPGGPPGGGGWQVALAPVPWPGRATVCVPELLSTALPSSSGEMQIPPGWGEYFWFSLRPNLVPVGARCLCARFNTENRNTGIYQENNPRVSPR